MLWRPPQRRIDSEGWRASTWTNRWAACGLGNLCACEAVAAELGLADCQIAYSVMSVEAALAASRRMREYSASKGPRVRVTADFLIGAPALTQADALLSSGGEFVRRCFNGLRVDKP